MCDDDSERAADADQSQRETSRPGKSQQLVSELKQFLVPASDTFQHRGTLLAGYSRPVAECGGDWWTARRLSDGKILILIADVMGHDLGSAIIMGVGKAVCDLACAESDSVRCAELLHIMNSSIFEAGSQGQVTMTCFVAVMDPDTRAMDFASAGHPHPLILRMGPSGCDLRVFHHRSTPLGLDARVHYRDHRLQLHSGDLVLWYTDGVTECRTPAGKRLSERRLVSLLSARAMDSPVELRDLLAGMLDRRYHDHTPEDDVTFVVGRIG
jgi:serine phosphatase RsbU (regulator of sigma subunit)